MNILFATEVYPMRNSFTEHSMVSKEFIEIISNLLSDDLDARLVCNNFTLDLLLDSHIKTIPSIIHLSEGFNKRIKHELREWSRDGLTRWNEYVNSNGDFAEALMSEMMRIHDEVFEYDMIVCWGENGVYEKIADKLNIPCVHTELSSTRSPFPEARFFDLFGSNGAASSKTIDINDLKNNLTPPNIDFWSAFFNIESEHNTDLPGFDDSSLTYYQDDITLSIFKDKKNKTALIGLQLYDDANMQRHSSFSSPLDFLKSTLPKLEKNGWDVVVKTHPGAIHRPVNLIEQNKAIEYAESFQNCYIYDHKNDERDYLTLLRHMDLVIVINSSMGFEASLLGKTVVIEGEALYKINNVYPTLDNVLNNTFSQDEYLQNLKYLAYFFSKYIFISKRKLMDPSFYENVSLMFQSLDKNEFDVSLFIEKMNIVSNDFLKEHSVEKKPLIKNYSQGKVKKGTKTELKQECLLFSNEEFYIDLEQEKTLFSLDHVSCENGSLIIDGWAFDKKLQTPPVLILILDSNSMQHIGRVTKRRNDVKEMFNLSHNRFGFIYNIPGINNVDDISIYALFSDNTAEKLN